MTDRSTAGLPFVDALRGFLVKAGLGHGGFADVSPNPTDILVVAGKAISLVLNTDRDLWDFDDNVPPPPELGRTDFVPLFCVPTTSGTGAETESTAMITDTRRQIKGCVWHPAQKPFAAPLDPELTFGLPRNLTAWTGCDALAQAIGHMVSATCDTFYQAVCDLLDRCDIPRNVADLGVTADRVGCIAAKAMTDPAAATNP